MCSAEGVSRHRTFTQKILTKHLCICMPACLSACAFTQQYSGTPPRLCLEACLLDLSDCPLQTFCWVSCDCWRSVCHCWRSACQCWRSACHCWRSTCHRWRSANPFDKSTRRSPLAAAPRARMPAPHLPVGARPPPGRSPAASGGRP